MSETTVINDFECITSYKIDTEAIKIPAWHTPDYKVVAAYKIGMRHAINHFYGEEADPDWPFNVKSWAVNPYTENRPSVFYSFIAGFSERWADLKRDEK